MNSAKMCSHEEPVFDFDLPFGYKWLLERKLVGYDVNSQLQPWYYLDAQSVFNVSYKWPQITHRESELVAFARRQDCDDIACFSVRASKVNAVVVIHGWTSEGYEVIDTYMSFWNWLKSVIDDIAFWVEG